MTKEINDLAPVLLAIGRQIAERKDTSCRADRPERDLPILLIPNSSHGLTGTEPRRDAALPFLLGAREVAELPESAEAKPAEPGLTPPTARPVYPLLKPDLLGGRA
jgi:hypothetical protein